MLGDDLVKEVLEAVNTVTIPEGWNNTTIVMIPKVENPDRVANSARSAHATSSIR